MKWLIALCFLLAALFLGIRSIQDSALNHQLYDRQRELGYPSKKRPFWIGKRVVSALLVLVAAAVVMPTAEQSVNNELEPRPMTVMQEESSPEKTRAVMMDAAPSIALNFNIHLIPKEVDLTDQQLFGFYAEDDQAYNVYMIDNALIFQDQDGNTYMNQTE